MGDWDAKEAQRRLDELKRQQAEIAKQIQAAKAGDR